MSDCNLSIIVVSHNVKDLTYQCLKSIYENTRDISFETILVDNESFDGSQDMVRRSFPQVHLICNEVGRGLAAANNQGLEVSKGRYVLTLNSDTVILPGAFDKLVRFMDENPEVGGATPKLILPDGGEHPPFCGEMPSLKGELLGALSPLSHRLAGAVKSARFGKGIDFSVSQEVPCILWGTAFIVRREVVDRIGGQDPRFFIYCEDTDWSMRITKAGWKIYYLADAEVIHYGGQSTKQDGSKMSAQLLRSKCRLIHKHNGLIAGIILRMAHVTVFGFRMFKWVVYYFIRPKLRAEAASRITKIWSVIRTVGTY